MVTPGDRAQLRRRTDRLQARFKRDDVIRPIQGPGEAPLHDAAAEVEC